MDEEKISEVRRYLAKYLDPKMQRHFASLGSKEFINTISIVYANHIRSIGVQHPDVDKLFLSMWEYLRQEVEDGIQTLLDRHPVLGSNPSEFAGFKLRAWRMGRDQFYEERIDEVGLQLGVDLRAARGYDTVKNLFSRKIESLETEAGGGASKSMPAPEGPGTIQGAPVLSPVNESDIPALAVRVKQIMAENDLSKKEVAAFIGRHRGTLDSFFAGRATSTTIAQILKLISTYESPRDST